MSTEVAVKETEALQIEALMEKMGTPTLKALAHVHDLPPVRLYTVAKQPREGQVYDPRVYNWDALQRFIERRFDAEDAPFKNLEDVIAAALKADEELKLQDGRRGGRSGGTKVETFEVEINGEKKEIQKRKYPSLEKDAEQFVALKKDDNVYVIVYQTRTHTVLVPVDAQKNPVNDEIIVKSNLMLNLHAVPPTALEKEVKERFDAAAKAAQEAAAAPKAEPAKETADPTKEGRRKADK